MKFFVALLVLVAVSMQSAEASLRGNRLGSFRGSLAAAADANPIRNLARTKQTARKGKQMMMKNPTGFNPGSTLANKPMSMGGMKPGQGGKQMRSMKMGMML